MFMNFNLAKKQLFENSKDIVNTYRRRSFTTHNAIAFLVITKMASKKFVFVKSGSRVISYSKKIDICYAARSIQLLDKYLVMLNNERPKVCLCCYCHFINA